MRFKEKTRERQRKLHLSHIQNNSIKLKTGGPEAGEPVMTIDYDAPDLSLAQLRCVSEASGEYGMIDMVKAGHFDRVVKLALKTSEDRLLPADLLLKSKTGPDVLVYLARQGQLALAFNPQLWVGRTAQMESVWAYSVSRKAKLRSGIDFPNLLKQARILTLQQESPKPPKLKRRTPPKR